MEEREIAKIARRYPRIIRWSEEDACYIGSLPDLDGDCTHGDTPEEVAANLDECAAIYVADTLDEGLPLPEPATTIIPPSRYNNSKNAATAIASLRRRFGMSQSDFAAALGITLSTLSKWETGNRRPSGASAKLLAILEQHPECITA